jgi:ankyrin repeat protein
MFLAIRFHRFFETKEADLGKSRRSDGCSQSSQDSNAANGILSAFAEVEGCTPLMRAVRDGNVAQVAHLLARPHALSKDAVNAQDGDGDTALHRAALAGNTELVEMLLRAAASTERSNRFGFTPLHRAAMVGDTAIVARLCRHGAQVDCGDDRGLTPLAWAAIRNHHRCVAMLHLYGGAIHTVAENGSTPLIEAALRDHAQTVAYLLNHGARVDWRNKSGSTALIEAVRRSAHRATVLLLSYGAEPNVCNRAGFTPLVVAVRKNDLLSVLELLAGGADPALCDGQGRSPACWARTRGHFGVLRWLQLASRCKDESSKPPLGAGRRNHPSGPKAQNGKRPNGSRSGGRCRRRTRQGGTP